MKRLPSGAAGRVAVLALTALALLASDTMVRTYPRDALALDALTSCGPAGVVTLWNDPPQDRHHGGCGGSGSDDAIDPIHADSGVAVGLPAAGTIYYAGGSRDYPGDLILGGQVVLRGAVELIGALPARTVTRVCQVQRASRDAMAVSCEGPDPESACTGSLTVRP